MKKIRIEGIERISKKSNGFAVAFLHSCDSRAKPESPNIPFTDATFIRIKDDNMNNSQLNIVL